MEYNNFFVKLTYIGNPATISAIIPQLFMLTSMIPIVKPYTPMVTVSVANEFANGISDNDKPKVTAPIVVETLLPTLAIKKLAQGLAITVKRYTNKTAIPKRESESPKLDWIS